MKQHPVDEHETLNHNVAKWTIPGKFSIKKVVWTNYVVNIISKDYTYLIMYEIKDVIWSSFNSPFLQPVRMGTSINLVSQVKVAAVHFHSINRSWRFKYI